MKDGSVYQAAVARLAVAAYIIGTSVSRVRSMAMLNEESRFE